MPKKFKTGDVVKLASGGVAMTVDGYEFTQPWDAPAYIKDDETRVKLSWYHNGKFEHTVFHEDTLVTYDPKQES